MIPVDAGEILDVFGPRVNILSSLELGEAEFTLIAGTVDPGVIVPLHSHPDRELFSITESDRGLRCRSVARPSRGRRAGYS